VGLPSVPGGLDPDAVLGSAPRARTVPALTSISHEAGPAGRVWATRLLMELAPEVGRACLRALAADPSTVEVNTCLRGYRTVSAWA
jgi:hypothetical protein